MEGAEPIEGYTGPVFPVAPDDHSAWGLCQL
jgi:hypothetical protein